MFVDIPEKLCVFVCVLDAGPDVGVVLDKDYTSYGSPFHSAGITIYEYL